MGDDFMLVIEQVREGTVLQYVGNSTAFGGTYKVCSMESTYTNPEACPEEDRGRLVMIEFTNQDRPMFFDIEKLHTKDWITVS